jgi:hypothetical protein
MQYIPKNLQYLWQFITQLIFESKNPISQTTVVFLHHYNVCVTHHTIVVHRCHSFVQSEILETSYFGKDVVEDTSLVYTFGEVHLFYCHLSRLLDFCLATVDHTVCT